MTASPGRLYVQFGCGFSCPEGWLNFDASPRLRVERLALVGRLVRRGGRFPQGVRFGDVRHRLPVADASCAGVYASHVLEHLVLEDFYRALDETWRILAPGGLFRAVVPDLEGCARRYLARIDAGATDANAGFMRESHLGIERRPRSPLAVLRYWIGNSAHLWMWDAASLAAALEARGFVAVRPAEFNDSTDAMFARVEDPSRFEDACAVEARRPDG